MRCAGKFEGCSTVWRAGPTAVSLGTRLSEAVTAHPDLERGQSRATHRPDTTTQVASSLRSMERTVDAVPPEIVVNLETLLTEVRILARKIDVLPDTISAAIGELRSANRNDLVEFRRSLLADFHKTDRALVSAAFNAEMLPELDARFEWLTTELSNRLVTVGNEIAAVKRQLAQTEPTDLAGIGRVGNIYEVPPFEEPGTPGSAVGKAGA